MDGVKVTILNVDPDTRLALKRACLMADTSMSAELRDRLQLVVAQIEGRAMAYNELADLLMAVIGVVNMALSGMDAQARQALAELNPRLQRFRHQMAGELRRPVE